MIGLFKRLKKELPQALHLNDDEIVAMADGKLIDVSTVPDQMFASKMMGDSVAFEYPGDSVIICAPANGTLTALFPTGHAFGITTKEGVELIVHIGIDTVNAKGDGFEILHHKQGDAVLAGEPIIKVDLRKLRKTYNMSTMLIVSNPNGKQITFIEPQEVQRGQSVIK